MSRRLNDSSDAGIDLIAAFYGSLYAGCVPITVRPPHPQNISTTLPTVKMIVEVRHRRRCGRLRGGFRGRVWLTSCGRLQVSHSACVMTTAVICKLLRSKEATATVDIRNWPPVLDTGNVRPRGFADDAWTFVEGVSLQTTSQRRSLQLCTSPPTLTAWPTWTSACPPQECWLEFR